MDRTAPKRKKSATQGKNSLKKDESGTQKNSKLTKVDTQKIHFRYQPASLRNEILP